MKTNRNNKKMAPARVAHKPVVSRPMPVGKRETPRIGQGPTKTFQQDGHWIVKTRKTPIYVCECGNRYLKTRPAQTRCLRCVAYSGVR